MSEWQYREKVIGWHTYTYVYGKPEDIYQRMINAYNELRKCHGNDIHWQGDQHMVCGGRRVGKKILPHPQSLSSVKKLMKRLGNAYQIVQAGPENNMTVSKCGITINSQYHESIRILREHNDEVRAREQQQQIHPTDSSGS